jgi:Peptidase A4 family
MFGVAALLLSAGTATAVQAATAAPTPTGVTVSRMTYQPGAHVPATHLPRITSANGALPVNAALQSTNWAGYADVTCGTCALRYVAASFTLPSLNCKNSPDGSFASFFVGLDGIGDSTVEQIGTTSECSGGAASYLAFYEMFPLAPVGFSGISPGDAISVAAYFNSVTNRWQLGLTDVTTGGTVATVQACPSGSACRNRSAEIITEAPSSAGGSILPLADFGQAGFEAIQVTSRNGTHGALTSNSLWTADSLTMVNSTGNKMLAVPGPAYGGQAFQDTWRAAQ